MFDSIWFKGLIAAVVLWFLSMGTGCVGGARSNLGLLQSHVTSEAHLTYQTPGWACNAGECCVETGLVKLCIGANLAPGPLQGPLAALQYWVEATGETAGETPPPVDDGEASAAPTGPAKVEKASAPVGKMRLLGRPPLPVTPKSDPIV